MCTELTIACRGMVFKYNQVDDNSSTDLDSVNTVFTVNELQSIPPDGLAGQSRRAIQASSEPVPPRAAETNSDLAPKELVVRSAVSLRCHHSGALLHCSFLDPSADTLRHVPNFARGPKLRFSRTTVLTAFALTAPWPHAQVDATTKGSDHVRDLSRYALDSRVWLGSVMSSFEPSQSTHIPDPPVSTLNVLDAFPTSCNSV
jgi:hypothetical protein